jgi:hypothetical protein
MMDMLSTVVPKSDQLNSDALLEPITITVTRVTKTDGADQPVAIAYEGDNGKPYKPCKSMRVMLITCWGKDGNEWVGKSMTLFNDPTVKWQGVEYGGIRISHVSHIQRPVSKMLQESRGKKKPYTVKPLQVQQQRQPAPQTPAPQPPQTPELAPEPIPASEPVAPPAQPVAVPQPAESQQAAPTAAELFVEETETDLGDVLGSQPDEIRAAVEAMVQNAKFKARVEKLRLHYKPLYTRLIQAFAHPAILDHAMQAANGRYEVFYFDLVAMAEGKDAA